MFCRVPYVSTGGRARPYLEVVFADISRTKESTKRFAMVDSGADHTVIPYSLGVAIGLAEPTAEETVSSVGGVGGSSSYLERECHIYLTNPQTNEQYIFKETVWWIYPDQAMLAEYQAHVENYNKHENYQTQTKEGTDLHVHFENEKQKIIEAVQAINNKLEGIDILLGRPFFDNFDFIQFMHKDRNKEERCFFNYKVNKKRPIEIN